MKNYSTIELKKEMYSRGIECFDPKEWALQETMWCLDDAIDALADLNRNKFQMDNELPHEVLLKILNDTLASTEMRDYIYSKIKENIKDYIEA
jgi:hypothetical protein